MSGHFKPESRALFLHTPGAGGVTKVIGHREVVKIVEYHPTSKGYVIEVVSGSRYVVDSSELELLS